MLLRCWWAKDSQEPLDVLTNRASADEACRLSATRLRIETFFSDHKSRGCPLHRSQVSAPARLSRFLMGACLASLWMMHLGARGEQDGWIRVIQRGARCARSLFQLGLRWLDDVLHGDDTIPVAF